MFSTIQRNIATKEHVSVIKIIGVLLEISCDAIVTNLPKVYHNSKILLYMISSRTLLLVVFLYIEYNFNVQFHSFM